MQIVDMVNPPRAAFPIDPADQIMLVTDGGKLIRSPVNDVRIASRKTRGVLLFRVGNGERVVSVERLEEDEDQEDNGDENPEGTGFTGEEDGESS